MKKITSLILIFLTILLSCNHISNSDDNSYYPSNEMTIPSGMALYEIVINDSTFVNSRNAIPYIDVTNLTYTVTAYKNGTSVDSKSAPNPNTKAYTLKLPAGTYDIEIVRKDSSDNEVFKKTKSINVKANNKYSETIEIDYLSTDGGTGKVNLTMDVSGLTNCKKVNVKGLLTSTKTYDVSSGFITINEENVSVGSHNVSLNFLDSSNKSIVTISEKIIVGKDLETTKWIKNGEEPWISEPNFVLTDAIVKSLLSSEIFVNAETGNDSNTGSWINPLKTVKAAADRINSKTESTTYNIYVSGTTNETASIEINKNVHIQQWEGQAVATIKYNNQLSNIFNIKTNVTFTISNLILDGLTSDNKKSIGIISYLNSKVFVKDSIIKNFSQNNGGAINSQGTLKIENSVIENCEASNYGGAIYSQETFTLTNTTIKGCQGKFGGGIYFNSDSTTSTIDKDSKIVQCKGISAGGGIMMKSSGKITFNGTIENCSTNPSLGCVGGGVGLYASSNFSMTGGTIKGCTSYSAKGVYVSTTGSFEMSGDAYIKENNDVYLDDGKVIKITGDLSPKDSNGTAKDYAAVITPASYPIGFVNGVADKKQALDATKTMLKDNYKKFKLSDDNYFLASNGYIYKEIPISNLETDDNVDNIKGIIDGIDDMKRFREIIETGKEFNNSTIKLIVDFYIDTNDWQSEDTDNIYNLANGTFSGTFDGNGHKLKFDIAVNPNKSQWLSFIKKNKGIIKDLTVSGFCNGKSGKNNNGANQSGICIWNEGLIINCTNSADFNTETQQHVAGICSVNEASGYIINCVNNGNLTNEENIKKYENKNWGGVYIWTGGIVAENKGTIENCVNKGSIKTNEYVYSITPNINNTSGAITAQLSGNSTVKNSFWKKDCITQGSTQLNRLVPNHTAVVSASSTIANCGWFDNIYGNVTQATSEECGGKSNSLSSSGEAATLLNNYITNKAGYYTYKGTQIPLKNWEGFLDLSD